MKNLICLLCFTVIVLVEFSCSNLTVAGGSSSTDNGKIIGKVCLQNGKPASDALVTVRPADYIAIIPATPARTSYETSTDDSGKFEIDSLHVGTYAIEVNDTKTMAVLLRCDIVQGLAVVRLPEDTMRPYAALKGQVDRGVSGTSLTYVQIYGLERTALVDSSGGFDFSNLPAGVYNLRIASNDTAFRPMVFDSIKAVSGQVTSLPYIAWSFSKRLYLNTSSSGAGVAGDVIGFPVLVRLTSSNFDFTRTKSNGDDVRFTKSDGTPIPFEFERWDAANNQAEIWVKVDTIYGNDSSHFITMYFGNPNATRESNGAAVFDTAKGFQGVWHLNEQAGTAIDATGNHFDGTPSDTAPYVIPGIIGRAQEFNGISNYIQMRGTARGKLNFAEKDTFTVSAWVYVDSLVDSTSHLIVGKGHQQYFLKLFFGPQGQHWEFTEFLGGTVWQITSYAPPVAKSWKFLYGMREGNAQFLYLDGVLVNSNISTGYPNAIKDTSNDVAIGRYLQYVTESNQGFSFFNGIIDEVRISNVSRSADWIKLEYMNQKKPDALIK
jgi:hypothetical protein